MKRILFITPYLSGGGAEKVAALWAGGLSILEGDIHFLVFYRTDKEYELNNRVKLHSLWKNKNQYNNSSKARKLLELRRKIKEINPDIILPFITYVGIMTTAVTLFMRVRIIETIRIYPGYSPDNSFLRLIRNLSVLLAKGCIVQNEDQRLYFPRFLRNRIAVFPNPISREFVEKERSFNGEELTNIISVGRLEEQKNFPMVINAFSLIYNDYPKLILRIYGEGSLKEELMKLIGDKGLEDRVFLCGKTAAMEEALIASDIFVLASNGEGMPNALMEAMAVGLPCISTDCPTGPSDLIEDRVNGVLIPMRDEAALVKAMEEVINNCEVSKEMGKRARKSIIENYSPEKNCKVLLEYLESL